MRRERLLGLTAVVAVTLLILGCFPVSAQVRIVGSISGTVTDPTGATVPGAKVTLKDEGTGAVKEATATGEGTFFFPDLAHGSFEVTVSSPGFQNAIVAHIIVEASKTTDVSIQLKVGQQTESVTVEGVAPVLEISSPLVATTQNTKLVNDLPAGGRDVSLGFARLVPGINDANGGTRVNNVAGGAINVTVDGINDASNGFKSGGTVWYNTVPVRLGALEEVTVETGGLSADSGAESGVNVKFLTRRGTNQYHGSLLYQPQSEQFNTNSWLRNAQGQGFRTKARTHTFGGNIGGPVVPFGYLKNKLFVFFNYEYDWAPSLATTTTAVMTPDAEAGIYKYVINGTTNQIGQVNVLSLAQQGGAPSAKDPVAQSYLALNDRIKQYARQIPSTDLNRESWQWTWSNPTYRYYPATRLDYYVTPKEQVSVTWNYRHEWTPGTQRFPWPDSSHYGPFRVGYFVWSASLQSTLSSTTFNEFRYGTQHSGDSNASATDGYGTYNVYNGVPLRIGCNLPFGNCASTTSNSTITPYLDQNNTTGRHYIVTAYDTVTMIRGQHSITAGGTYRSTDWHDTAERFPLPTYALGTPSGDPIPGQLFTAATVPGDIASDLPNGPASLYNTLLGRVASTALSVVVDPKTKQYGGFINHTWTRSYMGGLYVQDRWRIRPDLTLNYGLRWEAQGDMYDVSGITAIPNLKSVYGPSLSLFTPGVMSGNNDPVTTIGVHPYPPDYKNFAPNLGVAWNPKRDKGILGKLLGGSKTVLRASFGITYYDEGTQMFAANLGANTGKNGSQTLQAGTSAALPQFSTLRSVVNNPVQLSAFSIAPYAPVLHYSDFTYSSSFSGMKPSLVAPYVDQWNFGIQREIAKATVLEVRYVGTMSHRSWRTFNLNEVNVFENGFLKEFQNAQSNLAIANGITVAQLPTATLKTTNFANQGLAGQVNLPIMDAAFGPRGTVPAMAAANGYSSTTFANNLQNGAAGSFANTLTGQNYFCRMMGNSFSPCLRTGIAPTGQSYNAPGAGYPINFFVLNPYTTNDNFTDDNGWSSYNGLQVQLRKAFSHGLTWTTNYTFSKSMTLTEPDGQTEFQNWTTLRNFSLDRRPSPFDSKHVLATFGTYDLPIGRGRKLDLKKRWLDALFGGWTAGSVLTFSTGSPVQLGGNYQTFNQNAPNGIVLGPGVTVDQIEDMFHNTELQKINQTGSTDARLNRGATTNDWTRLGVPLSLIGPDGRANPQYLTWNTTPGTIGQIIYIYGKNRFNWNASLVKTFRVMERMRFQLYGEANNVLNHPTWALPNTTLFSTSFGTVGNPTGQRSMTFRGLLNF